MFTHLSSISSGLYSFLYIWISVCYYCLEFKYLLLIVLIGILYAFVYLGMSFTFIFDKTWKTTIYSLLKIKSRQNWRGLTLERRKIPWVGATFAWAMPWGHLVSTGVVRPELKKKALVYWSELSEDRLGC